MLPYSLSASVLLSSRYVGCNPRRFDGGFEGSHVVLTDSFDARLRSHEDAGRKSFNVCTIHWKATASLFTRRAVRIISALTSGLEIGILFQPLFIVLQAAITIFAYNDDDIGSPTANETFSILQRHSPCDSRTLGVSVGVSIDQTIFSSMRQCQLSENFFTGLALFPKN